MDYTYDETTGVYTFYSSGGEENNSSSSVEDKPAKDEIVENGSVEDYIPNEKIIAFFDENKSFFSTDGNCSVYPNIKEEQYYRELMPIKEKEVILFANRINVWPCSAKAIAITDWGIWIYRNDNKYTNFCWNEIDEVSYTSVQYYNYLFISNRGKNEIIRRAAKMLIVPSTAKYISNLRNLLQQIVLLSKIKDPEGAIPVVHINNQQRIIELFDAESKRVWASGLNSGDSMLRPYIEGEVAFRKNFNIGSDETVLYCRDTSFWNDRNQGSVITEWGIRAILDNNNPNNIIEIAWEDVNEVTADEKIIYFWAKGKNDTSNYGYLSALLFFKGDFSNYNCQELAKLFTQMAQCAVPQQHPALTVLNEMDGLEESDPDKAWEIGTEALGKYPDWDKLIQWNLGYVAYFKLNDNDRAWKMFVESLKGNDLPDSWRSKANYWCSNILYEKDNNNPNVRSLLFNAAKGDREVKYDDNTLLWEQSQNEVRALEKEYFGEKLAERPYAERKLIFPVNNLFGLSTISQEQVMPVELDSLTANDNLQFPLTHPQANQLYVAHPYNPNVYLLYDNYEIEILQDKLREFSEIAQALGATEIDVKVISSHGSRNEKRGAMIQSGRFEHWTQTDVGASQSKSYSNSEEINFEHMFNRHQTFAPKSTISQPQDTIWLQGEPSWQRLIKQRLEGGLTSHREVIETKSSRVITGSASTQLKGEMQSIFADINLNWDKNEESRYSEHNNLVLSVDIKFSNLQKGSQTPSSVSTSWTTKELEYKEEYEACLADGVIAASERRLLDRLARKLGLSPKQVKRIEKSVGTPLTDEEKEYLEEYRACLADEPELSSSTRRLLSRMAKSLGLTEEQVNKLENLKW